MTTTKQYIHNENDSSFQHPQHLVTHCGISISAINTVHFADDGTARHQRLPVLSIEVFSLPRNLTITRQRK
jgi:hypothetical protein